MNLERMFEDLCEKIESNNKANEGDYYKDGLLYCCLCNTPKQTRVNILGKEMIMPCVCKCTSEMLEEKENLKKEMDREQRIKDNRKEAFATSKWLSEWTFDNAEESKAIKVAKGYVDGFEDYLNSGEGLIFYGTVGTGKSYAAACIVNALTDKGYKCLMANVPSLIDILRDMDSGFQFRNSFANQLNKYDLLVLDDLSMERDTEYMNEQLSSIIDTRWLSKRPTIITTNLTADEIRNPANLTRNRVYSRIWDMCCPCEVSGVDRRRKGFVDRHAETRKRLGI